MNNLNSANIFPVLKPMTWATEREIALRSASSSIDTTTSVGVAFAADQDENLNFFPPDALSGVSVSQLFDKAKSNLRREITDVHWHSLSYEEQEPGLVILALINTYFAAEAILLPDKLQEAHQQLDAKRLLVCTPIRGQLCAMAFDKPVDEPIRIFVSGCLDRYYAALNTESSEEAISPAFWIVESGEIIAKFDGHPSLNYRPDASSKMDEVPVESTDLKLFTYPQIIVGSFLGTVLCGFIMLWSNFRQLQKPTQALNSAILGVVVTAMFMYAVAGLPDTSFDRLFPLAGALVVGAIAYWLQGGFFKKFKNKRNRKSGWAVALVIAASLLIVLLFFVGLLATGMVVK